MTEHAAHKQMVARFLTEMADAAPAGMGAVLAAYCHADAVWEIFHPFNTLVGSEEVLAKFWSPLKTAFPDYEHRLNIIIGGAYEDHDMVSTWGELCGSFFQPWIGIPPTQGLTYLNFGMNVIVTRGKIAKAYILLDVLDVMRQAGLYPLRPMPGSPERWPAPPAGTGVSIDTWDGVTGEESIRISREMQVGLGHVSGPGRTNFSTIGYSAHWHKNKNWYGSAGIGSARGKRGFREYHGRLFLQAFPDRAGVVRDHEGPQDGPGHYIRIGDGNFAVTSGWPSIHATHTGGGWCGVPPSGRKVEMRVADWYRLTPDAKIIENWVSIDIPHILFQAGLDVLDEMQYYADRTRRRWPD